MRSFTKRENRTTYFSKTTKTDYKKPYHSKSAGLFHMEICKNQIDKYFYFIEDDDALISQLSGAEEVIACHQLMTRVDNPSSDDLCALSYDDALIRRYTPKLQNGVWLNETSESNIVEAVISENGYG